MAYCEICEQTVPDTEIREISVKKQTVNGTTEVYWAICPKCALLADKALQKLHERVVKKNEKSKKGESTATLP